jgi:hypothetical protein
VRIYPPLILELGSGIDQETEDWEKHGLLGPVKENGKLKWRDYCVSIGVSEIALCDWLRFDDRDITVSYVDKAELAHHKPSSKGLATLIFLRPCAVPA